MHGKPIAPLLGESACSCPKERRCSQCAPASSRAVLQSSPKDRILDKDETRSDHRHISSAVLSSRLTNCSVVQQDCLDKPQYRQLTYPVDSLLSPSRVSASDNCSQERKIHETCENTLLANRKIWDSEGSVSRCGGNFPGKNSHFIHHSQPNEEPAFFPWFSIKKAIEPSRISSPFRASKASSDISPPPLPPLTTPVTHCTSNHLRQENPFPLPDVYNTAERTSILPRIDSSSPSCYASRTYLSTSRLITTGEHNNRGLSQISTDMLTRTRRQTTGRDSGMLNVGHAQKSH